jgi:hypothetical protein
MKKIKLYLLIAGITVAVNSSVLKAENSAPLNQHTELLNDPQLMINRLHTIKDMDLSALNGKEKKDIRNEVLSIQESLKTKEGGIFLSVGAIIIILLILILIL